MDTHSYVVIGSSSKGGYIDKFFHELFDAQQFSKSLVEDGYFVEIYDEELNEYSIF